MVGMLSTAIQDAEILGWLVLGDRVGLGVESCKIVVSRKALLIHFCCRMYHLATMHITDGQIYKQHYHANSQSHCVQHDRLITEKWNKPSCIPIGCLIGLSL